MHSTIIGTLQKHRFLFEELVKRDFKKKYKRTVLGMGWSLLMPLLTLLVLKVIFQQFFGRTMTNYTTYLFCGLITFQWFSESTMSGMRSLFSNSGIFTRLNVPKYLFTLSVNVQTLINFLLTLIIFFIFCAIDGVPFTWRFILLAYPISTLLLFNIGIGMVLSAFFVFFRDIDYLWSVAVQLTMYGSAIFYSIDSLSPNVQIIFACNPIYRHIAYIREIVLAASVPSAADHLILLGCAFASLAAGTLIYKYNNTKFLYYV